MEGQTRQGFLVSLLATPFAAVGWTRSAPRARARRSISLGPGTYVVRPGGVISLDRNGECRVENCVFDRAAAVTMV